MSESRTQRLFVTQIAKRKKRIDPYFQQEFLISIFSRVKKNGEADLGLPVHVKPETRFGVLFGDSRNYPWLPRDMIQPRLLGGRHFPFQWQHPLIG